MPNLFEPLSIRNVVFKNRIVLAPMMQYRAIDGFASDWHLIHFGKFALGGFAAVMTEVVAVEREGRISHGDLGLWSDQHTEGLKRCVAAIHAEDSLAAIQIGHAGRKASVRKAWEGGAPLTDEDTNRGAPAWQPVGPSPIAPSSDYPVPQVLSLEQIAGLVRSFATAARRADQAGFDILEIHGAHGYLIASFLSPLSNLREDEFGGDLNGRMQFALKVGAAVRAVWPANKPLFFRISAEDGGGTHGWGLDDSLTLSTELKAIGVDILDCSSGGIQGSATVQNSKKGLGYQVPFSDLIRRDSQVSTMAVGLILTGQQAEKIISSGQADLVAIGRQALYDPYWPLHAQQELMPDPDFNGWNESTRWWLQKRATALKTLNLPIDGDLNRFPNHYENM
jgi:2,4-dienoyl-CoA reductase-like NADH-dependent reductase (Old Yellow Enzyme family)